MARKDEATKKAKRKYQQEKCKNKGIQFSPVDADILEYAESKGNFSGYIKDLIRADMEKNSKK